MHVSFSLFICCGYFHILIYMSHSQCSIFNLDLDIDQQPKKSLLVSFSFQFFFKIIDPMTHIKTEPPILKEIEKYPNIMQRGTIKHVRVLNRITWLWLITCLIPKNSVLALQYIPNEFFNN